MASILGPLSDPYVISHWLLRRIEVFVVRTTTRLVKKSTANTFNQNFVVDIELNYGIDLCFTAFQQLVQL